MYGSVSEIIAELAREYGHDEPLAVLVWNAEAVRFFAQDWSPDDSDVLEVLRSIGETDAGKYQRCGIGQPFVEETMQEIVDSRNAEREVSVNAAELEKVLNLAENELYLLSAAGGDGHGKRHETELLQAVLKNLREALHR